MPYKILLFILLLQLSIGQSYSQGIYPEKFEGCNTDRFALESDSTIAKISDVELLQVVMKSLEEKSKKKIKGVLTLQVIVDLEGNSCLISLKNETNITTRRMNLKELIDKELLWQKPQKKVAALIAIKFDRENIEITRLGFNANRRMHKLRD